MTGALQQISARGPLVLAFCVAVCVHGGVLLALADLRPEVQIEGASGTSEVRLGSSFADMVQGTMTPVEASLETARAEPQSADPVIAKALEPVKTASLSQVVENPAVPAQSVAPLKPVETSTLVPLKAAEPIKSTQEAAQAPEVEATAGQSLRPQLRPKQVPTAKLQATPRTAEKAVPAPRKKGNAQQSASAGQATGTKQAKAASQGSSGRKTAAGNAAVSNYPGQVSQCIARVGRPRFREAGKALIGFKVGGNGAVQGAYLAKSSGNARLDREAVALVQRAGPCPPPPAGAQTGFQMYIIAR